MNNDREETHELRVETISDFDRLDIGERQFDMAPDLQDVRNILVTGGYGFLGSFLVRKLVVLYPEYHIYVVDKLEYRGSTRNLKSVKDFSNFTAIRGDITSPDFMTFILREKKIDVIFHLAAQTHVDRTFGDSFEFTTNNVMATHVMLEAARIHRVKRFIHVSTDEVYGGPDAILAPSNPYSATKAAAEFLVKAYHKSFGLPTIITRSNSIYGPYQYPEKIISKFICSLIRGGKCYIHGDGQNSRKYLYAADVADALDVVFRKGQVDEIYNIGSTMEFSNLELCKKLIRLFGYQDEEIDDHIEFVQDRPLSDKRYDISYSKIEDLGWKAKIDIDQGLLKTKRINYDAMGWGKSKNDGRLFAVRTVLWGGHNNENGPWQTLDAGEYSFPFVCQLPLVNYPPSFEHHFIATTFTLAASLERPGQESFQSDACNIYFQPILETSLVKPLGPYTEEVKIAGTIYAFVSLPSLAYNVFEHKKIPVRLSIHSSRQQTEKSDSFAQIHVYLKRHMTIFHDSFSRTEATTISQVDQRVAPGDDITVNLHLPQDQTVTLCYSKRFSIDYRVGISVKTRHGPLITKKKLLSIPITFGTLPVGARAPADLTKFTDDRIINDTTLRTKPKFLRPMRWENELPAYDLVRPPSYSTAVSPAVLY